MHSTNTTSLFLCELNNECFLNYIVITVFRQQCCCSILFVIIQYYSSHTQTGTCTAPILWTVLSLLLPCGVSDQVFSYGKLDLDLCNENLLSTQKKTTTVHSRLSEPL